MATPPALGYGTRGAAPIDAVNQWMRAQPWYQQLLASWGQSPSRVQLNDAQKAQVIRAAQANGVVVDEGHDGQQLDDSGNFEAKGHGLRNTLIVAGIAGAALLTAGAAGAFAGAAGAGGGAGAGGSVLASTATAPMVGALAPGLESGSSYLASLAAGAGGGGGVVAGASAVPWGAIVSGGTQLFGNLFAAHEASAGADRAAEIAAAGAKYSAELTAKANAESLQFQYANAENAFQNNEASRQGNYGIFAARERRLGSIGDEVGLGPREIPAYVPGVDPLFGGGPAGHAGPGASPAANLPGDGEVNWSAPPDQLGAQLTAYYQKRGVGAAEVPYWVAKAPELVARGQELQDPLYASKRLAASNIFGGGGGGAAPAITTQPLARTLTPTSASPYMNIVPVAAGVPQSIGYYA